MMYYRRKDKQLNLMRRNSSNQKETPASVPLARHNELEAQLNAANEDNRALREKVAVLEQEIAQLRQEISELSEELRKPLIGL